MRINYYFNIFLFFINSGIFRDREYFYKVRPEDFINTNKLISIR